MPNPVDVSSMIGTLSTVTLISFIVLTPLVAYAVFHYGKVNFDRFDIPVLKETIRSKKNSSEAKDAKKELYGLYRTNITIAVFSSLAFLYLVGISSYTANKASEVSDARHVAQQEVVDYFDSVQNTEVVTAKKNIPVGLGETGIIQLRINSATFDCELNAANPDAPIETLCTQPVVDRITFGQLSGQES